MARNAGYRPDEHQLLDLEFHASRFDGDDPGRLSITQFEQNPNQSTTPFNKDWVDRYSAVLRYERDFGDGWLLQAKGWYTHQEIDTLGLPFLVDQNFNNGGIDLRMRKNWGDDTRRGSRVTPGCHCGFELALICCQGIRTKLPRSRKI